MIQITPHMRILVAIEPVDFRRGIDGIAQLCRAKLRADPFCGTACSERLQRAIEGINRISEERARHVNVR